MNKRAAGVLGVILALGLIAPQLAAGSAEESPLKVSLSSVPKVRYTRTHIPLKVTFENTGDESLRILRQFEDPRTLPVFFEFEIKAVGGGMVQVPGAGKITPYRDSEKYVELKKGQTFEVRIDLARLIPPAARMPAGLYDISVIYHNQYGTGFKGRVASNSVRIKVT